MKKTMHLLLLMVLFPLIATAQQFKYKLANTGDQNVMIAMDRESDFTIQGYDGDQVMIDALDYQPPPEKAKGMKALYAAAEDNTGIGLSVTKENNVLRIVRASRQEGRYTIKIPDKANLKVEEVNFGGKEINISNMKGEIEIKSKTSNVKLTGVSGPVTASSISGNIMVVYSDMNMQKPTSISDISGTIDITLPAAAKADFKMKSVSGEVYTDFDMDLKNKRNDMQMISGGSTIEGSINGGGVDFNLNSVSGNIYVRKKK